MKQNVKGELSKVSYACTTADIWSSYNRSFFGVTAHWIDIETLTCRSVALACLRARGRHTYNVIGTLLNKVHTAYWYCINNKVVLTVTDNGSNFVKAFVEFASEEDDDLEDQFW